MSKFRRRLTRCVFSVVNMFHLNFLGNGSQRLEGFLADQYIALAAPDTGAERNVMDSEYAKNHGLHIWNKPEYRGCLQFADGSFQETLGQVHTFWTFTSGERIPITFEVLENCCSDIIIGEDILWDYNVFKVYSSSIFSVSETFNGFRLAPFGYQQNWQTIFSKQRAKDNGTEANPESILDQRIEEDRRRKWNHEYGFDGARASAEERAAEKGRRDDFRALSQQQRPPSIPSIPTTSAPGRTSQTRPPRKRGISNLFRRS
ncbi:hypothetical protein MMC20_007876 [Loxospora ochrophaea]|nr:hypothetical protein [Loxospora ochrophaea]